MRKVTALLGGLALVLMLTVTLGGSAQAAGSGANMALRNNTDMAIRIYANGNQLATVAAHSSTDMALNMAIYASRTTHFTARSTGSDAWAVADMAVQAGRNYDMAINQNGSAVDIVVIILID